MGSEAGVEVNMVFREGKRRPKRSFKTGKRNNKYYRLNTIDAAAGTR